MSEIEKYYNGEIHIDFDDEIEELKADIEEYRDSTTWWQNRFKAVERDNRELKQEIERLNNIINVFEIIIKTKIEECKNNMPMNEDCLYTYEYILDKLQELKGSDKE